MSLVIQSGALKGAAPRALKLAIERHLDGVADQLSADQHECLDALQAAANKLISRTPAGKRVDVQLILSDCPFGGVQMSVSVSATLPPRAMR